MNVDGDLINKLFWIKKHYIINMIQIMLNNFNFMMFNLKI